MPNLDDGTSGYLKGTASVATYFPIDRKGTAYIACEACRFYRRSSKRCGLTDEVIPWPDKYTGRSCPLTLEEEENGEPWNL